MTETLTDAEIDCLRTRAYGAGEKALAIIDSHAAERAALEAVIERVRNWTDKWRTDEKHEDSAEWFMRHVDEALAGAGAGAGAGAQDATRPKGDVGATPTEIVPTGNTCSISRSTGAELAGAGASEADASFDADCLDAARRNGKVLSDALAARNARIAELAADRHRLAGERNAANARAEAAERAAEIRETAWGESDERADRAESEATALRAELTESEGFRSALRGELDKARAEVERLRQQSDEWREAAGRGQDRLESLELTVTVEEWEEMVESLAAATELLHELDAAAEIMPTPEQLRADKRINQDAKGILAGLIEMRQAFLANAPNQAAPTRNEPGEPFKLLREAKRDLETSERNDSLCERIETCLQFRRRAERAEIAQVEAAMVERTDHERAVLEACREWTCGRTAKRGDGQTETYWGDPLSVVNAVLAWREAER